MGTIRAFLVGVSDYSSQPSLISLPYSNYDVMALSTAIRSGLEVDQTNITILSGNNAITVNDFLVAFGSFMKTIEKDDTLIFYFSGHGYVQDNHHFLVFSDESARSQIIINAFDDVYKKMNCKNKIVLIDTCMAGSYTLSQSKQIESTAFLDDYLEHGCTVLASCSAEQVAGFVPGKPISLFTAFLCLAIASPYTIRNGQKTFENIKEQVLLYARSWNAQNPAKRQTPIYRSNVGGTIVFNMNDYRPYQIQAYYSEAEDYIIYSVEPTHTGFAKRYSCKVILKNPAIVQDVAKISKKVSIEIRDAEVYPNKISEQRWSGKRPNLVTLFFGYDVSDVVNSNFAFRAIWADDTQDKAYWYKQGANSVTIDDICVIVNRTYEMMHKFNLDHTGNIAQMKSDEDAIISRMISLADKVVWEFHEFQNETFDEAEFIDRINPYLDQINTLYLAETDLDLPPVELHDWCQSCQNLAATIHNFYIYYGSRFISQRTTVNRMQCMTMTIKQYTEELGKLRDEENKLTSG